MKKLFTLLVCLYAITSQVKAQYVNIPDTNFRNWLITKYPTCFNSAKQMDTTCSAVVNEDSLDLRNLLIKMSYSNAKKIALTEIMYFKRLKYINAAGFSSLTATNPVYLTFPTSISDSIITLIFSSCRFFNFPVLPKKLKSLDIKDCDILSFINSISLPNTLEKLNIGSDSLTNIPFSLPNGLKWLDCSNNNISSLPNIPSSLEYLNCQQNSLSSLSGLPIGLKYLYAFNNKITSIPNLPSLLVLDCSKNKITTLPPLSNAINYLDVGNNLLQKIFVLPDSLSWFRCTSNLIDSLPIFSKNIKFIYCDSNNLKFIGKVNSPYLERIDCSHNQITQLYATLPRSIRTLVCNNNNLINLPPYIDSVRQFVCHSNPNLYCLPYFKFDPTSTGYIEYDTSKIKCLSGQGGGIHAFHFDSTKYVPIIPDDCNPTNNKNQCINKPTVSGKVFYDYNNNGIKDTNEIYGVYNKITLSNGNSAVTRNNGQYEIYLDSTGMYTIYHNSYFWYKSIPDSININITRIDTSVHVQDIALQAISVKDSFSINCSPLMWAARPNRSYPYQLHIENNGTTTLNPIVSLSFDSSILQFDSASITNLNNLGNKLSINFNNFLPGQATDFIAYFTVKVTAKMGAALQTVAHIIANNLSQSDTSTTFIRSSYDPNDKHATLALTPTQVSQGKYIDYVVNFQNTGNDTAFNVVIADTLDKKLDATSLQVITASHKVKTTVKDGVTYFEFLNIMLVDSNTNEPGSHGFVRFKIRPKKTVQLGDTLFNQANIYFDYNTAINTNITKTVIKTISIVTPINLLSYEVKRTNQHSILNSWQTTVEENVQQFNIQRSYTGKNFETVGVIKAQNKPSSYSYLDEVNATYTTIYYRLQIINKDGSIQYSDIQAINVQDKAMVQVYPNPSSQYVLVKGEGLKQIVVKDVTGKILQTIQLADANQFKLDVQTYTKGLYVLEVVTKNEKVITKLVKQ